MKLEYDNKTDAAFIWFDSEINNKSKDLILGELWPKELKEHIGLLFGESEKLIGLEILFASKHLPEKLLK